MRISGWSSDVCSSDLAKLVMGDPRKEKTFVGPMIDEDAAKRVESWIKAARKGGATLLAGGAREGNMLPATLLENVPHDADLYRKEAFGPAAGMESFDDFADALRADEHTYEHQSQLP